MKHILIFIFSGFCGLLTAQQKLTDSVIKKTERYGIRLGADAYRLARSAYDGNYEGVELVGDYRLSHRFWLAAEMGNEKKRTNEEQLSFTTKGSYFKIGFDYNGYENWLDMQNIVSIGLRYGMSSFSHTLQSYAIYNPNPYFGEAPLITPGTELSALSASWVEVVAGVKVEVLKNIFIGFSARLNHLIANKEPNNFSNLYIPGFNRTYEGPFGVGFNYTITYFVPIYKKPKTKALVK